MFLPQVKNIFASQTQMLLPKHLLPSLATMKAALTSIKKRCFQKQQAYNNAVAVTREGGGGACSGGEFSSFCDCLFTQNKGGFPRSVTAMVNREVEVAVSYK